MSIMTAETLALLLEDKRVTKRIVDAIIIEVLSVEDKGGEEGNLNKLASYKGFKELVSEIAGRIIRVMEEAQQ